MPIFAESFFSKHNGHRKLNILSNIKGKQHLYYITVIR